MNILKAVIIACLVIGISFFHMTTVPAKYGLHILHSELFFIPIILGSFWFGLRIGLAVAVLVCMIYAPMVINGETQAHATAYPVLITQLAMYVVVSALIGWLSDRQQVQQQRLIEGERVTTLSRAAAALSFEIRDAVSGLDCIHQRANGLKAPEEEIHFKQEMDKLNHLVDALSKFIPTPEQAAISTDLNNLLEASYRKHLSLAKKAGIELVILKDQSGCPSMIMSESLDRVLDALVDNALEASQSGGTVVLRSRRGGADCILEVEDQGYGIPVDNRDKLFTPFFTTKPQGNGLALAAGRKVLRDHGGDLVYQPGASQGSIFQMIIPRENKDRNITEFVREKQLAADG